MTTVKEILDFMVILIPEEYKSNLQDDFMLAERGVVECSVALNKEFSFDGDGGSRYVREEMSTAEKYLASHFAYRCYLMRLKDELTQTAVNFSTLTFSIKGLEKRPESINDTLYQLNRYLQSTVDSVSGASSIVGMVTSFGG